MATKKGSTPVRSEQHGSYFQAITPKRGQPVSFTAVGASASGILHDETSICEVMPDQDCWVIVGPSGSTTAVKPGNATPVEGMKFCFGGVHDFVGVDPNITNPIISVIGDSTSGTIRITEGK